MVTAAPNVPGIAAWITWERHRRTRSIAEALRIPLTELTRPGGRFTRYFRDSLATIRSLSRLSGRTVVVQAPSVVLGNLAISLRGLLNLRVVVDAHNAVVEGAEHASQPLRFLYRRILRRAHVVIVTNSSLAARVTRLGGNAAVLPDPVPPLDGTVSRQAGDHIVVISTWADDEPIAAVLQAAQSLREPLHFVITGRPRGALADTARRTRGVKLSGFVSDSEYVELLRSARVIVDLTLREDCLVCGAYEALAVGRPLIVSDSRALRELLKDGAAYTANEPEAIGAAVARVAGDDAVWADRCADRRESYSAEWTGMAQQAMVRIASGRSE